LVRAADLISQLELEAGARLLEPLGARFAEDADVQFELAVLRLHRGEYATAQEAIDRAIALAPRAPALAERRELRALIASTSEATASFAEARSPDGRFIVRYAPGPDAVLVPYALDALVGADRALTAALGFRVPGPVRLEIFPTPRALSRVSSLSVADIERTGTVALCKWDRLMVTSPRALVRGYPWMDTIGHEYVHLVLARASKDRAPVWLQEGIAKFLEARWRGDPPAGAALEPASSALLFAAVRDDQLLPFDRLHPSIALLPSQEAAALAFAQVATFIESFVSRYGEAKLRDAIARVAAGVDARVALGAAVGKTFAQLEGDWRSDLRARPSPPADPPSVLALHFRRGGGEADESLDVAVDTARQHLRLGDLLWGRQRARAAAAEYAKAHVAAPDDPIIASRLARAALAGGDARQAVDALTPAVARYPDQAPIQAVLGAARLALGDLPGARTALREALRINPFDPAPHCDLARATDLDAERAREDAACRALRGAAAR
jgi:tetratricopeptide (TPR) repeat protein